MILADKIIMLRKQRGWSQEDLAARLDISRQSISKWESASSIPDLDKIIKLSQLFDVSTDYLLKDDLEENVNCSVEGTDSYVAPERRAVTLEEASNYIKIVKSEAIKMAFAIAMYVVSPIALIILAGMSEYQKNISEDFAAAVGLVILLIIVAIATGIVILSSIKLKPFEYMEQEILSLQYGVEGVVTKEKNSFEATRAISIAAGVILCILSVVPLFIAIAISDTTNEDFYCIIAVGILLFIVACGVYLFVWSGMRTGCVDKLLQSGDYSVENKEFEKKNSHVAAIYWSVVTAIYLAISFITFAWESTWIIWPVAGVLYGAIVGIMKMSKSKENI